MAQNKLQRAGLRVLVTALVLTCVFGLGSMAGIFLWQSPQAQADDHAHDHDVAAHVEEAEAHDHDHNHEKDHDLGHAHDHDHDEEEEEHLQLSKQAVENLQLQMGKVTKGTFWKTLLVPGRVVEIPGKSRLSISAGVTGVIEQVNLVGGQSLEEGATLFTIRITDESLIQAQSKLLESLTSQEVAETELQRLRPLVSSGAVSGTRVRELEYEIRQLESRQSALRQELKTRGLSDATLEDLAKERKLITLSKVVSPEVVEGYSVESMLVHPGMEVKRGAALCTLAFHPTLHVEGAVFQDDYQVLEQIAKKGWLVSVESHGDEQSPDAEFELAFLRVDNHMDEQTQTVKFYLELPNEVTHSREDAGRRFEQWKFRPGQRLHLRLPVEQWVDQVTLPADAVVIDGPKAIVFAEHHHEHPEEESGTLPHSPQVSLAATQLSSSKQGPADVPDSHEDDVFMELEPVEVHLLYRNDATVVIADDGQLHLDEEIAVNNAQKLYLALKMQAGDGGGHHHHDH